MKFCFLLTFFQFFYLIKSLDESIIDLFNKADSMLYPEVLQQNIGLDNFDQMKDETDFVQQSVLHHYNQINSDQNEKFNETNSIDASKQINSNKEDKRYENLMIKKNNLDISKHNDVPSEFRFNEKIITTSSLTLDYKTYQKIHEKILGPRNMKQKEVSQRILMFGYSSLHQQMIINQLAIQQKYLFLEIDASDILIKFNHFDPQSDTFAIHNIFKDSAKRSIIEKKTFLLQINNIEVLFGNTYDNFDLIKKIRDWMFLEMNIHAPGSTRNGKFRAETFSDLLVIMTTTQPSLINEIMLEQLNCDGIFIDFPDFKTTTQLITLELLRFESSLTVQKLQNSIQKNDLIDIKHDNLDELDSKLDYIIDQEYEQYDNNFNDKNDSDHESENLLDQMENDQIKIDDFEDDIAKKLEEFQKKISFIQSSTYVTLETYSQKKKEQYMMCKKFISNSTFDVVDIDSKTQILVEKSDNFQKTILPSDKRIFGIRGPHTCIQINADMEKFLIDNTIYKLKNGQYEKSGFIYEDYRFMIENIIKNSMRVHLQQLETDPITIKELVLFTNFNITSQILKMKPQINTNEANQILEWAINHKYVERMRRELKEINDLDMNTELTQFFSRYLSKKVKKITDVKNQFEKFKKNNYASKNSSILEKVQNLQIQISNHNSQLKEVRDLQRLIKHEIDLVNQTNQNQNLNINRKSLKDVFNQLDSEIKNTTNKKVKESILDLQLELKELINKGKKFMNNSNLLENIKEQIIQKKHFIEQNIFKLNNDSDSIFDKQKRLNHTKNQVMILIDLIKSDFKTASSIDKPNMPKTQDDELFDRLQKLGVVQTKDQMNQMNSTELLSKIDKMKEEQKKLKKPLSIIQDTAVKPQSEQTNMFMNMMTNN